MFGSKALLADTVMRTRATADSRESNLSVCTEIRLCLKTPASYSTTEYEYTYRLVVALCVSLAERRNRRQSTPPSWQQSWLSVF